MPLEMVNDDTGQPEVQSPLVVQEKNDDCTPALMVNFEVKLGCGDKSLGQYIQDIPAQYKFLVGGIAVLAIMKITKII